VRNPFRKPTPLEQASSDLVAAQHGLLTAQLSYERACAEVNMRRQSCIRLRRDIAELSSDQATSVED
jgi:hypothetical protein